MASPDIFNKKLLTANIKWKGRTFNQLISGIKQNSPTYSTSKSISPILLRRALPLKIYRREIASESMQCNPRTSMLYQFDNPGQTIVTQYSTINGLATTLDFNYENSRCQHPPNPISSDPTCQEFLSQENNAKRRVRSSGMIRRKFDTNTNNDTYYTDTNQYLTARNRTYKQTQYFHIKQGDPTAKPGTNASYNNIYTANGISHCPKFKVTSPVTFTYKWLNNIANSGSNAVNSYTVTIPIGSYNINEFNSILQKTMYNNNHYLVLLTTNTITFFLQFIYNVSNNRIELDSLVLPQVGTIGTTYQYPPIHSSWVLLNTGLYFNPNVTISSAPIFTQGLGFSAGTYPTTTTNTANQSILGNTVPALQTNYIPIYYKPNNPQFGRQGAVTSGDLITRKRYNTITQAANTFRSAYGNQTADAVAYGVPSYGYTLKDRIGFPNIKIPTLSKYTGGVRKCMLNRKMRNMRFG